MLVLSGLLRADTCHREGIALCVAVSTLVGGRDTVALACCQVGLGLAMGDTSYGLARRGQSL